LQPMKACIILALMLVVAFLISPASAQGVNSAEISVQLSTGSKSVKYVSFHPSEQVELKPVLAENKVGCTESLQSMADRQQGIAAINGSFFNAYDQKDLQPMGNIMIDKIMLHYRGGPTTLGISPNNILSFISSTDIKICGGINGSRQWPNNWYAWFINHVPNSTQEIVIFTPSFRQPHLKLPGFTLIVVSNGKVTAIQSEQAVIPAQGFIIAIGGSQQNQEIISRFQVGDQAEYWMEFPRTESNLIHSLSAGPKLLTRGQVDIDFAREKITDPKLVTYAGQRSFIGYKADGTVIMGTVSDVTIQELAEVLLKLALTEAMNLDGGASSGLYYKGHYMTAPGRDISNSLILVPSSRTPGISVNGQQITFSEAKPFIQHGTTMVPVRGVFEALGADIEWINETSTVVARRRDTTIILPVGDPFAEINGTRKEMQQAPINKDGHVYIPLRFVSEALDATVQWNEKSYMVNITCAATAHLYGGQKTSPMLL